MTENVNETIERLIAVADRRRAARMDPGPAVTTEQADLFARFLARSGFLPSLESATAYRALAEYMAAHFAGVGRKGLLLWGLQGRGKTLFLRLLTQNFSPAARWTSALGLVQEYQERGAAALMAQMSRDDYDVTPDGYRQMMIDDVGREPLGKRYGETFDVLAAVVDARYRAWQRYGYAAATWFTSNFDGNEMATRYDGRTVSRLAEMCEVIELTGPDWRLAL